MVASDWDIREPELLRCHQRLKQDDPTATADFVEIALPLVLGHLRRQHVDAEETDIWDATSQTLLDLCQRPTMYDDTRWPSIRTFLKTSADRDLKNALEKRRKHSREQLTDYVELREIVRIDEVDAPDIVENIEEIVKRYASVLPDQCDQEILSLMLQGERQQGVFCKVLGIAETSSLEQKRLVKNAKDRIKKKIQRAGRHVQ